MAEIIGEKELLKIVEENKIILHADVANAKGLKYDLRIGNSFLKHDFDNALTFDQLKEKERTKLLPGETIFVLTEEYFCLPNNVRGRLEQKRKLGLDGIILFGGSILDPGYEGYLQFGLFNAAGAEFPLSRFEELIGISFERLSDEEAPIHHKPAPFKGFSVGDIKRIKDFKPMDYTSIQEKINHLENTMQQDKSELTTLVSNFKGEIGGRFDSLGVDLKTLKEDVHAIKGSISAVFTARTIALLVFSGLLGIFLSRFL